MSWTKLSKYSKSGCERSTIKTTLLEKQFKFPDVNLFAMEGFPEYSHEEPRTHSVTTVEVRLRPVDNYTYFTGQAK
jgi:hypothetical protein